MELLSTDSSSRPPSRNRGAVRAPLTIFDVSLEISSYPPSIQHLQPRFLILKLADYFISPELGEDAAHLIQMDLQFAVLPMYQKIELAKEMKVRPWLHELWLTLIRGPIRGDRGDVVTDEIASVLPSRAVRLIYVYKERIRIHLSQEAYDLLSFEPIGSTSQDRCLYDGTPLNSTNVPCGDVWIEIMHDGFIPVVLMDDTEATSAAAIIDWLIEGVDGHFCGFCRAKFQIAVIESGRLTRKQDELETEGYDEFCKVVLPAPFVD